VIKADYFCHHQGTAVIEVLKLIQKAWISYFQSLNVSVIEARHKQKAQFRCIYSNKVYRGENSSEVRAQRGQGYQYGFPRSCWTY